MSFRPSSDPMGGPAPLVDKMIGTAYDVVRLVALHIQQIKHVSDQLEAVTITALNVVPVKNVSNNMETVIHVSENMSELNAIAAELNRLVAISTRLNELVMLANNLPNIASVNAVSTNMPKIVAVEDKLPVITNVEAKLTEIDAVYDKLDELMAMQPYTQAEKDKLALLNVSKTVVGTAPALGATANIALGTGVDTAKITSVVVSLKGTDNAFYFPDGKFTFKIVGTNIVVALAADATAEMAGGAVKAQVTQSA